MLKNKHVKSHSYLKHTIFFSFFNLKSSHMLCCTQSNTKYSIYSQPETEHKPEEKVSVDPKTILNQIKNIFFLTQT